MFLAVKRSRKEIYERNEPVTRVSQPSLERMVGMVPSHHASLLFFFFLKQQKLPDLCVEWTLSDLLHRLVTRSLHSIYSLTKEALLYHLSIPMKHHVRKKKIVYIYRLSVITRDFRKKREEEHHSIALYVIGCYC